MQGRSLRAELLLDIARTGDRTGPVFDAGWRRKFVEPAAPFLNVYRLPQTTTSADLHRFFDRYLREHMTWLRSQFGDGGFHNMGEFRFVVGNPTLLLDRKARCYRRDHGHDPASRCKSRL
nr:hypothetical protein [Agrobacterium deltaense]